MWNIIMNLDTAINSYVFSFTIESKKETFTC